MSKIKKATLNYYMLDGTTPILVDDEDAAEMYHKSFKDRIIWQTHTPDKSYISTMFVGIEIGDWRNFFEQLTFDSLTKEESITHCSTWSMAMRNHMEFIRTHSPDRWYRFQLFKFLFRKNKRNGYSFWDTLDDLVRNKFNRYFMEGEIRW